MYNKCKVLGIICRLDTTEIKKAIMGCNFDKIDWKYLFMNLCKKSVSSLESFNIYRIDIATGNIMGLELWFTLCKLRLILFMNFSFLFSAKPLPLGSGSGLKGQRSHLRNFQSQSSPVYKLQSESANGTRGVRNNRVKER